MSDCRSVCSNYHQSSQSRKISIGVVLDSVAKRKLGAIKEDVANSERIKPSNGISSDEKNKGEAVTASKGKNTELVKSPWITPRSVHRNSLAPETTSSNLRPKKHKNAKNVAVTYSVQVFSNQTFNAKNVGTKQNSFDCFNDDLTCKRKGRNDGSSQKVEEFNNANAGKFLESDRVVLEGKVDEAQNVPTETLKMKLQELFANVSSPKSQLSSSQDHGLKENNLKPDTIANHMGDTVVKPRQCSDTIETDSENPDQNIKRPVTHSLTRKQAPSKVQTDKTRDSLSSKLKQRESIFPFGGGSTKLDAAVNTKDGLCSKQKHRESIFSFGEGRSTKLDAAANTKDDLSTKQKHRESIFSFGEGRSTYLDAAANTSSKLSGKKQIQKNSFKIDPRKICFTEEDNADEIKQTSYRSVTPVPAGKTSTLGNKMESFPGSFSGKMREKNEKGQENHSFHSPVTTKKNQPVNFDNPTSPEEGDKQEDCGNISLRNDVYTLDNFQSPTFGFRTPILNTSPSPTPKTVEIEQGAHSPVPSDRGLSLTIGNIRSFRTFQASKPVRNKSNGKAHSPVSLTILQDSDSDMGVEHIKRYEQSETSSEEKSENSEDGLPISKRHDCHTENPISPDTDVSEKPNFVPCPIKRSRNHEDVRLSECSPTSASQIGERTGETFWFQGPSDRDQEDELTRAVTLFASALQTFKRKMNSTARKKSSDILVSISEEIKSLLLNAQSEIESDVGKLASLNKTKKKCLETRLQEQQDHLKLILEKFKEDIHHHILDCNNILEGMEAHQFELKGVMKKQKVSHQKLLMHVKEAAETQLNNAERRVTAVHESSREKMLQIKRVIAECLKDSIY